MAARLKAPVGIVTGGENSHRLGHVPQAAADGVVQQRGAQFGAVIKYIDAFFIQHAAVDMHAVAGFILEGLGHEAGDQAVLVGHALDQALHHYDLLGRQHRVVDVLHIDFVLGGRRFLHHAVKGQVLDLAGDAQVLKHRLVVIEHVQPVGVAAHGGLVGQAGASVQRHRLVPAHQAEFQLGGDHRAPALFLVESQHLLEHMAGIAHVGSPVIVEHGQHDLAVLALGRPGGGEQ